MVIRRRGVLLATLPLTMMNRAGVAAATDDTSLLNLLDELPSTCDPKMLCWMSQHEIGPLVMQIVVECSGHLLCKGMLSRQNGRV